MSITSREKLPCEWNWCHIKAATRLIWPYHDVTVYQKMTNCEQAIRLSCDLDIASTLALVPAVSEVWESVSAVQKSFCLWVFVAATTSLSPLRKKLLWLLPKYSSWNSWISLFAMKWNMKTLSVLLAQIPGFGRKFWLPHLTHMVLSLAVHWSLNPDLRRAPVGCCLQSGHCAMSFRKGHSPSLIQLYNLFIAIEFYMKASVIRINMNRRRAVTTLLLVPHREWVYHPDPFPSWL